MGRDLGQSYNYILALSPHLPRVLSALPPLRQKKTRAVICDSRMFSKWAAELIFVHSQCVNRGRKSRMKIRWERPLGQKYSLPAGFEPARETPNGFQVHRLNHSAKAAGVCLHAHFMGIYSFCTPRPLLNRARRWSPACSG